MDISSEPFPAPLPGGSKVEQAGSPSASSLYKRDHEGSRTFCNTSTLRNSARKVEVIDELRNADINLDARSYQSSSFASQLMSLVIAFRVPVWAVVQHLDPSRMSIYKASGSLTNAVYFVSYPPLPSLPTILLRIYGSPSSLLISRAHECRTLRILSSLYHIGPYIYGTFSNGRVEEYFDGVTLSPSDLRKENISRWIGANMAELHSVDISAIEGPLVANSLESQVWEIGVKQNVKTWLPIAQEVVAHPNLDPSDRTFLNLDAFAEGWVRYLRWLSEVEQVEGASRRVFAHNDAQCGNILRLTRKPAEGTPEHRQLVLIDFEYASPNPLAFDIANHFHEWTTDYRCSTPHLLDFSRYPTAQQRRNFYLAYLSQARILSGSSETAVVDGTRLAKLGRQVSLWSPASHGMWSVWGIVRAKDDVLNARGGAEVEFDYIGYAKCRMERFFYEIAALGV